MELGLKIGDGDKKFGIWISDWGWGQGLRIGVWIKDWDRGLGFWIGIRIGIETPILNPCPQN